MVQLHDKNANTFGTAFIVHVDGSTAYLVTCAHVVEDCQSVMQIGEHSVERVGIGRRDELDLAVVKVEQAPAWWQPLPLVDFGSGQRKIAKERLCAVGFREIDDGFRCIALDAQFRKFVDVARHGQCELRLFQFDLPISSSEQPRELTQGYSGSPLLAPCGVYGVVDLREQPAEQTTYKIGTAIPLWHLAKIWPEIPDPVGEKLFGDRYWPILKELRASAANCEMTDFYRAFIRVLPDQRPEEYSLWGCALTLARFETEDQPVARLERFVQALSDITQRTDLVTVPSFPVQRTPDRPVVGPGGRTYRRLILRILEQRRSPRSDRQPGKRYEVQVHTATCDARDGGCCGRECVDCASVTAGRLKTVWARSLEHTSESGLPDVVAEKIEDIVGVFGREQPDLVQIMAPEGLLPKAIFKLCLDQLQALGPTRLCVLHPTVFSGESRSNPGRQGRYLLPRIGPSHLRWTAGRVRLRSVAGDRDLYQQLGPETNAVAVTADPDIAEQCLYSPVPVIVMVEESVESIEAAIDATACLHRLPRELHKTNLPHQLIYDTPSISIDFAEARPHVDGT